MKQIDNSTVKLPHSPLTFRIKNSSVVVVCGILISNLRTTKVEYALDLSFIRLLPCQYLLLQLLLLCQVRTPQTHMAGCLRSGRPIFFRIDAGPFVLISQLLPIL